MGRLCLGGLCLLGGDCVDRGAVCGRELCLMGCPVGTIAGGEKSLLEALHS